jgi:hypothetical protein
LVNATLRFATPSGACAALQTMTDEEGLSLRETAEWCGSCVTVREITRLRRLDDSQQDSGR